MKKGINKKKIFIVPIILTILLLCSLFIFIKIKNKDKIQIIPSKLTAKILSSKYDNIKYSKPIVLKNNIITEGGSYNLKGDYKCLTINTLSNVQLNLINANITCDNGPAIYIEDSNLVNINSNENNTIKSITTADLEGAIYTKDNLMFTGNGNLDIISNYAGIVSKDTIIIKDGNYTITSNTTGIKGRDNLFIIDGTINIKSKSE